VQPCDGEHLRKAGVAQRGFVLAGNSPAVAGDQRGGDAAGAFRAMPREWTPSSSSGG
jgi:hypothetical protein